MKVIEMLKIIHPALKMLSQNEVNRDDWRYVPVYEEFWMMREHGMKYEEAVRMLAKDYGIGRATVERAIARLGRDVEVKDCDTVAVYGTKKSVKRPHKMRGKR